MDLGSCCVELHYFMLNQWVAAGEADDFDMRGSLSEFAEGPAFRKIDACEHGQATQRLNGLRNERPRDVA